MIVSVLSLFAGLVIVVIVAGCKAAGRADRQAKRWNLHWGRSR